MNIVTIGGGTGTFVVLSGLKTLPDVSLSAIVTTADDGGSSGHLRDAFGFLPIGDARQALVALAEDDTALRELFAYRFSKGDIQGHNLGNLFLTALTDLLGSESAAIEEATRILRVRGRVIPATVGASTLKANLSNGTSILGENAIQERDSDGTNIASVELFPATPLCEQARQAILDADYLILGPGNLYASTIAALLPLGTKEAIQESHAKIIYFVNLFTKRGQTDSFTASDHVREVGVYAGRAPDHVIINKGPAFSDEVLSWYANEGENPVLDDLSMSDPTIHHAQIVSVHVVPPLPGDPLRRSLVRHDSDMLRIALTPLLI
jgi:uncharacterized cofD-like protein